MRYQLTSKVAVEIPQKRSGLQKVCLVAGIVAVVVTVATILIDGFRGVNFLTGVFVPLFLLLSAFRKNTKIDYVPTTVNIALDQNQISIHYPSVKYHIDEAPVSETYVFSSDNIRQFQFSAALGAIRFYGLPVISINDKKQIDTGKMREKVVYLPSDDTESICFEIERFLGITAERKEN